MTRTALSVALLLGLAATAVARERPEMELRLYDVSKLTAVHRAVPGPELGPDLADRIGFLERPEEEPDGYLHGDALVDVIRYTISPETWDEWGEIGYRQGGVLIVRAPRAVLDRIAEFLAGLQAAAARRILVRAELYSLPPARHPEVLAGADPARIEDAGVRLLGSGSTVVRPGLTASIAVTNRVRYVANYRAEIAQGATLALPVVPAPLEGLVVDLHGHPTLDGSRVLLRARLRSGRFRPGPRTMELPIDEEYLPRPYRSDRRTRNGRLELPVFEEAAALVTRVVAAGGSLTIPIVRNGDAFALRLTVEVAGGPEPSGALPVGSIVGRLPGGAFGIPPSVDDDERPLVAPVFIPDHRSAERLHGGAEELMDLVTRHVQPERWESGGTTLNVFGTSRLYVTAPDALIRAVRDFLAERERESLRTIGLAVEVRSTAGPFATGETTPPSGGAAVRYAAGLATLPGELAGVMTGNRAAFLAGYEGEVAQESRIAEPIVGLAFEGLVANLRPLLSLDGSRVEVEVEMLIASRGPFEAFDTAARYLGPVDRFETARVLVRQTVEMAANGSYVIDAGPDPEDPTRRLAVVITSRVP